MTREPDFLRVPFGEIQPWDLNPRDIKKADLEILAEKIKEFHLFKNFVTWKEDDGTITTGGGNMRWQACKKILLFPDDKEVWISLNYPESEREKIELSLLDNMQLAIYLEQDLAEMLSPYQEEIDLSRYKLNVKNYTVDLKKFVSDYGPGDSGNSDSSREESCRQPGESENHVIAIVCESEEELIEIRDILGIAMNHIEAEAFKNFIKLRA